MTNNTLNIFCKTTILTATIESKLTKVGYVRWLASQALQLELARGPSAEATAERPEGQASFIAAVLGH